MSVSATAGTYRLALVSFNIVTKNATEYPFTLIKPLLYPNHWDYKERFS